MAPAASEGSGEGLPPAAAAAFAALRQSFRAGLPRRWDEITQAGCDADRRAALHRLAGAAASFGLPALGALARRAEQAVGPDQLDALRQLELELRAAIDTLP